MDEYRAEKLYKAPAWRERDPGRELGRSSGSGGGWRSGRGATIFKLRKAGIVSMVNR